MDRRYSLSILSILLFLLFVPQIYVQGQSKTEIEGTVKEHSTGNPFPHVNILAFTSREILYQGETDSTGYFNFSIRDPHRLSIVTIFAYYDDPSTPGFDYVPAAVKGWVGSSLPSNITFELWDGASVIFKGEAFFVQFTGTIKVMYEVLVSEPPTPLDLNGYEFNYLEECEKYKIPGINHSCIVVPTDYFFRINVSIPGKWGEYYPKASITIDQPGHFGLEKGEVLNIDLTKYTVSSSLTLVKQEASETNDLIQEKEIKGFYLAVEKQQYSQVMVLLYEADTLLSLSSYEDCYNRLRSAYVELQNLKSWLERMHGEAFYSVFILIFFLAFTATITSHLIFEENIKKVGGALAIYPILLLVLYLLYPGSQLIGAPLFLGASLLALLTILGIVNLFPRVLKGRRVSRRIPIRNMIIPIFSIAKRSLRRRKIKTILTFVTVMILVSSFIALTSFATGFGLTFSKEDTQPGPSTGILVRAPKAERPTSSIDLITDFSGPSPMDIYWYPPLDYSSVEWFETRSEVRLVAPKYENLPRYAFGHLYNPIDYIGQVEIFGIIGIVPSTEAEIIPWNETVAEGRFLDDGDENGVLISSGLKEILNTSVGANITLEFLDISLKIVGILDDEKLSDLRDFDGQSLLPKKIIKLGWESELGMHKCGFRPCSVNETLVVNWHTASQIHDAFGFYIISISRLNLLLGEGIDLKGYSRETAINKGFRVWASTEEGIYLAQLSSYFIRKGLPLAVPWGIVVLNVVITMLSSLYERQRDINIYSAIGMTPSHIAGAFLTEAAMIGIIGGSTGYLLGMGWYKIMSLFTLALQVKQKVSAVWVLGALAIAMTAVMVGGYAAIRGSVVLTPSLRRKWRVPFESSSEPLELLLPVKVTEEEVDGFVEYIIKRLKSLMYGVDYITSLVKESQEETREGVSRFIEFVYRPAAPGSTIHTRNQVVLRREKDSEHYTVKFSTKGQLKGVQRVSKLIRQIIMEWSIERGKIEG